MEYLARNLYDERLLIVLTSRDDERGEAALQRARWNELVRLENVSRLRLEPLERADVEHLVAGLTGQAAMDAVSERLFERAGGNPFHLRELVAADPTGKGQLPQDLRELLLEQLDALDEYGNHLVGRLALISRPSDPALLTHGLSDEEKAESTLRQLVTARLIDARNEDGLLEFRHALLREAIVSDLLPAQRRSLHEQIAQALEQKPALAPPGAIERELAVHWFGAGENAKALAAARRDATRAAKRGAHGEAASAWELVLEASGDEADHAEIHRLASEAAGRASDYERALAHAKKRVELATIQGPEAETVARIELAVTQYFGGDPNAGYEISRAVQPNVAEVESAVERVRLRTLHALLCTGTGRRVEGYKMIELARSEADPIENAPSLARMQAFEGNILCQQGEIERGPDLLVAAVDPLCAANRHGDAATALSRAGEVQLVLGEFRKGLEMCEQGIKIGRSGSDGRDGSRLCSAIAAQAAYRLGLWSRLDEPDARQRVVDRAEGFAAPVRALVYLEQEDPVAAQAEIDRAFAGGAQAISSAHAILAEAEFAQRAASDLETAIEYAREAIQNPDVLFQTQVGSHLCAKAITLARSAHTPWNSLEPFLSHLENCKAVQRAAMNQLSARTKTDDQMVRALREKDLAERLKAWNQLIDDYVGLELRVDATRARIEVARLSLEAGDRRSAASELATARSAAVEIGMVATERKIDVLLQSAGLGDEISAAPRAVAAGLTPREITVLRLLVEERTNRQIGQTLFISPKTASVHVTNLLRKLDVKNRNEAAQLGQGLLSEV